MKRTKHEMIGLFSLVLLLVAQWPADSATRRPVRGRHGMVASTHELASRVGAEILKRGGNAIDAAVAVGLALAVVYPAAGNLGGGGFMLIRLADGRTTMIDYREMAPLRAHRDLYLDERGNVIPQASTIGYKAVAVPGTVAGLSFALEKYGTRSWTELIQPAETLAREGFTVSRLLSRSLMDAREALARFPDSYRIFLRDGNFYQEGEILRQPELAATLRRLMERGPNEFYRGETARMIVEDMAQNGGLITLEDLQSYRVVERQPLRLSYRGYEIITAPPPSSGGVAIIQMLRMLESYDLASLGHNSAAYLHLLVEVMRRAFADRAHFLGDPDFSAIPVASLTSSGYLQQHRRTINLKRATPSRFIKHGQPTADESEQTTHYTIIDAAGNIVSNTYTLNGSYGSGVVARGTGILLNNEMDDFSSKPGVPNMFGLIQGEANSIGPRKRPLSAMTPTIVLKDGQPMFAVGSPGGPTIINTVLQTILNVIEFKMDIQQAIDMPRIHHQWLPDEIVYEPFGLSRDTMEVMKRMGHKFRDRPRWIGDAHGIMIEPETGMRLGASDARLEGRAIGY